MKNLDRSNAPSAVSPDLTLIRHEVRRARLSLHMTQTDLAKILKCTQAAVSDFETGKHASITMLEGMSTFVKKWRSSAQSRKADPLREDEFVEPTRTSSDEEKSAKPVSLDAGEPTKNRSPVRIMRDELIDYLGDDPLSRTLVNRMTNKEVKRRFFRMELFR